MPLDIMKSTKYCVSMARRKGSKMGRPVIEPAQKRTVLVTVRFRPAEYHHLANDAKAAGRTVAEHLRSCWQERGR